jgi:RNA polymerase sigma factor (TIGR02999 family)
MSEFKNITKIINSQALQKGAKVDFLFTELYPEVKKIANAQLRKMGQQADLSPTMLVNECFIKLKKSSELSLENRKHFYSLIARCMRFYLVDLIRQQNSQKNSGVHTVMSTEGVADTDRMHIDVLSLHQALAHLESIDEELAQVVELKFFGGFSFDEMAGIVGMTKGQVYQKWLMARSILLSLIEDAKDG